MKSAWPILAIALALAASPSIAAAGPKDWVTAGQDAGGQRFSRAAQITPANVAQLKEAWVYHLQTDAAKAAAAVKPARPPAHGPPASRWRT